MEAIVYDLVYILQRGDLDQADVGLSAAKPRQIKKTPWPELMDAVYCACIKRHRVEATLLIQETERAFHKLTLATAVTAIVAASGLSPVHSISDARKRMKQELANTGAGEERVS